VEEPVTAPVKEWAASRIKPAAKPTGERGALVMPRGPEGSVKSWRKLMTAVDAGQRGA
jgi:hypothetical protein